MFASVNPSVRMLVFRNGFPDLRLVLEAVFLYFLFPFVFSLIVPFCFRVYVKESFVSSVLISMSIITGFLFNAVAMVYRTLTEELNKGCENDGKRKEKLKLLYRFYVGIFFGIFLGFLIIVVSVFFLLFKERVGEFSSAIYVYLLFVFLLTFLRTLREGVVLLKC